LKVIYVAGAYRSKSINRIWENINHAMVEARKLWLNGWAVICPHANTAFMDEMPQTDEMFLQGDLEILKRCDAIYMLQGWEKSVGAAGEYELAKKFGLEIYYEDRS
jgi:hypothetical protein